MPATPPAVIVAFEPCCLVSAQHQAQRQQQVPLVFDEQQEGSWWPTDTDQHNGGSSASTMSSGYANDAPPSTAAACPTSESLCAASSEQHPDGPFGSNLCCPLAAVEELGALATAQHHQQSCGTAISVQPHDDLDGVAAGAVAWASQPDARACTARTRGGNGGSVHLLGTFITLPRCAGATAAPSDRRRRRSRSPCHDSGSSLTLDADQYGADWVRSWDTPAVATFAATASATAASATAGPVAALGGVDGRELAAAVLRSLPPVVQDAQVDVLVGDAIAALPGLRDGEHLTDAAPLVRVEEMVQPAAVAGEPLQLQLRLSVPAGTDRSGRDDGPLRLVVMQQDAAVLDLEVIPAHGALSALLPPLRAGVAFVTVLAQGKMPVFQCPLLVLPERQQVEELQRVWHVVAHCAAAAVTGSSVESDARAQSDARARAINAGVATAASTVSGRSPPAGVWQRHFAPLLVDLAFILSAGPSTATAASATLAADELQQHQQRYSQQPLEQTEDELNVAAKAQLVQRLAGFLCQHAACSLAALVVGALYCPATAVTAARDVPGLASPLLLSPVLDAGAGQPVDGNQTAAPSAGGGGGGVDHRSPFGRTTATSFAAAADDDSDADAAVALMASSRSASLDVNGLQYDGAACYARPHRAMSRSDTAAMSISLQNAKWGAVATEAGAAAAEMLLPAPATDSRAAGKSVDTSLVVMRAPGNRVQQNDLRLDCIALVLYGLLITVCLLARRAGLIWVGQLQLMALGCKLLPHAALLFVRLGNRQLLIALADVATVLVNLTVSCGLLRFGASNPDAWPLAGSVILWLTQGVAAPCFSKVPVGPFALLQAALQLSQLLLLLLLLSASAADRRSFATAAAASTATLWTAVAVRAVVAVRYSR